MKRLLIIGAGGQGRCCLDIARESNLYNEICFLDDQGVGQFVNGAKILGNVESLCEHVQEYQNVFVALGNGTIRKRLIEKAESLGCKIVPLVSPRSIVSDYAKIGRGSVIFPGAVVEANAEVQKGCIVAANAVVNHDAIVRDYALVNPNAVIRPNAMVGELVRIGSNCVVGFGRKVDAGSEIPDGEAI